MRSTHCLVSILCQTSLLQGGVSPKQVMITSPKQNVICKRVYVSRRVIWEGVVYCVQKQDNTGLVLQHQCTTLCTAWYVLDSLASLSVIGHHNTFFCFVSALATGTCICVQHCCCMLLVQTLMLTTELIVWCVCVSLHKPQPPD